MDKLIYIADDEENIRNLVKRFLESSGYKVEAFDNGDKLLEEFEKKPCDLVILDIMMPGSDDYFTKPFSPMSLVMRVKAIFRRIDFENSEKNNVEDMYENLKFGGVTIDKKSKNVKYDGKTIELTPNELSLLTYLFENKDRAVSREELLNKIWGYDSEVETRAADDTVKRLRKKISNTNIAIETVWGFGFRLKEN